MTSRERVLTVLKGGIPDSIPRALYGTSIGIHNGETLKLFDKKTGKHPREAFRNDLIGTPGPCEPDQNDLDRAREAFEESRKSYCKEDGVKLLLPEDIDNPLFRELYLVRNGDFNVEPAKKRIKEIHDQGYASVFVGTTLYQQALGYRGQVQFLMDLMERPSWLEPFLDLVTEVAAKRCQTMASLRPDIICCGDDLGMQKGLIMSPETWCDFFKPRLERIFKAIKKENPDTFVAFHCCGDSEKLIEHLIEIGVDILNPIQPKAINPEKAREIAKDRLTLWGGVCVQHTLPFGSPQDVYNEVKLRIETIGKNGRYLLTPAHMLNDVPWENIEAFFAAADKYGNY